MKKTISSTFKKKFPTLGVIEFKIASTPQEMEDALSLVYREYVKRELINPQYYKHPIRIGKNHLLKDETRIWIGLKGSEVVITISTFQDSPLGLPMDSGYHDEAQALRDQGRKISEAGYLAVKSGLFKGKKNIAVQLEKLNFIFTIFRLTVQYGQSYADVDDACIVTNPDPRRKSFKLFPLDIMGDVKHYGFDEMNLNPKPAIAKRINFKDLRPAMTHLLALRQFKYALFRIAIGRKIPHEVFTPHLNLTPDALHYFFVEKSDILKNLKPQEKKYVMSTYGLSEEDYKRILHQSTGK